MLGGPAVDAVRHWLARGLLAAAAVAALWPFAVAFQLTQRTLGLERFREPTLVLYGLLLLAWLAHGDLAASAHRALTRARDLLAHPRAFPLAAAAMLGLYLLASFTRHLAFDTYSHDFSMIDEALFHSSRAQPLDSPVLGRSFLSEHFSPILLPLVPLHRLWPSPWLLLVLQPVLLWSSGLVLRRVLSGERLPAWASTLACLAWWNHPTMVATVQYPVHMESALPLLVLSAWHAARRGRWAAYVPIILLALAVKEDVGLYVAGLGVWLMVARRAVVPGLLTVIAGVAWTALALEVAIPAFAPDGEGFRFLGHWAQWGDGPIGAALGLLMRPFALASHLVGPAALQLFACLLFLPFTTRWGWLLFAAPWVVNTTSANPQQAALSLYYGIPLLAFAALAAIEGLASGVVRRVSQSRVAPAAAVALVVLNVAHFSMPAIETRRTAILEAFDAIPADAEVLAMSCFHPVLGYERRKRVLRQDAELDSEWIVLRTHSSTWPVGEPAALLARVRNAGYEPVFEAAGTFVLHHARSRSP